jgi:hypothetical protein
MYRIQQKSHLNIKLEDEILCRNIRISILNTSIQMCEFFKKLTFLLFLRERRISESDVVVAAPAFNMKTATPRQQVPVLKKSRS